jgi:hypothetical protein
MEELYSIDETSELEDEQKNKKQKKVINNENRKYINKIIDDNL